MAIAEKSSQPDFIMVTRLLEKDDRRELFDILLDHTNGDLKMASQAMRIQHRGIYRYFSPEKKVAPNAKTSANILYYLLRETRKEKPQTKERVHLVLARTNRAAVASLFSLHAASWENLLGRPPSNIPPFIPHTVLSFLDLLMQILLTDITDDPWLFVHPEEKRKIIMNASAEINAEINRILSKYH